MNHDNFLYTLVDALNAAQVPYLVVGSFSSNYHGIPRSTHDLDVVVELGASSITALEPHLPPTMKLDRQLAFEGVTGTTKNLIYCLNTEFKIEIFRLSKDPHDQERFRRRELQQWTERRVWLPTPEDVVITKLRWLRRKDIEDILAVISVKRKESLDWDYIYHWTDQHATREILNEILKELHEVD